MNKDSLESEMIQVIDKLKSYNGPCLDQNKKQAIKSQLMSKLLISKHERVDFSIYSLVGAVRVLAEKVILSTYEKVTIKEKLLNIIENHGQRKFFWSNFFVFSRKFISSTLVLVITFGFFSFFNIQTAVVRAATFTTLDSFEGKVLVQRNGRFVKVLKGMELLEKDSIVTGVDGNAVVRYFDDSVSRLAGDSRIMVKKLIKPAQNSSKSYVEIALEDGRVWSRVLSLVETDSVFVVEAMGFSTAARKAAFNVEVDKDKLEIGVFNHTVDVENKGKTEKVITGEKLVVDEGFSEIRDLGKIDKNTEWVTENLQDDREYLVQVEKQLLEAKKKSVGFEETDDISFDNTFKQDALLFLTFDDVKKKKIELDLAERNFVAAQVKLHELNLSEDEKVEAQAALDDFATKVKDFYKLIDEVAVTDEVYSQELKKYVAERIGIQKRDLSFVFPDSPGYAAKKVLEEIEVLSVDGQEELVQLKIEQAGEKLAIAEDFKARGDDVLASKVVDEYKTDIVGVVKMIDGLGNVKLDVKEQVADNIDLLEAIEIVSDKQIDELKEIVAPVVGEKEEQMLPVQASEAQKIVGSSQEVRAAENLMQPVLVEEVINEDVLIDGPFGVEIRGDKPLSPLLQNIE